MVETNFKQKAIRDNKHLSYIRKLNCAVCGMWPVEATHIRNKLSGGMGMKPGDNFCMPQCHDCHARQHQIGQEAFFGDVDKALELCNALWVMTGDVEKGNARVSHFRRSIRT